MSTSSLLDQLVQVLIVRGIVMSNLEELQQPELGNIVEAILGRCMTRGGA